MICPLGRQGCGGGKAGYHNLENRDFLDKGRKVGANYSSEKGSPMFKKFTGGMIALSVVVATLSGCTAETKTLVVFQDAPVIVKDTNEKNASARAGERLFFAGVLKNSDKKNIGEVIGQLTTFDVTINKTAEVDRFRELAFNMNKGQILALGVSEYIASNAPGFASDSESGTAVIVGGTGEYFGVQGTVTSKQIKAGTYQHTFVFVD